MTEETNKKLKTIKKIETILSKGEKVPISTFRGAGLTPKSAKEFFELYNYLKGEEVIKLETIRKITYVYVELKDLEKINNKTINSSKLFKNRT